MSTSRILILTGVVLLALIGIAAGAVGTILLPRLQAREELERIAALYEQGDYEQSRTQLQAFIKEHPSNVIAWMILGHTHENLDEDAEAEQAYLKAIELDSEAYQAYTGMGILARKKGAYDQAIDYYNKAITINPQYAQAYSSMAIIEIARWHDPRALELAEKAYQLDAQDPVIAANLAAVYHYNKRFTDRDRMYQQSEKLGYAKLESLKQIFSGELTLRD
jgi:tetratricopeptide (TPR) repeat protein